MRGAKPKLQALDGGIKRTPPMPASLPPEMADVWQEIAADLVGRGLLNSAMLSTLEVFVRALWTSRLCQAELAKRGIVIEGARGPKTNPAVGLLSKTNEALARLAAELGLTPTSRSRAGVQQAEAAHAAGNGPARWDF